MIAVASEVARRPLAWNTLWVLADEAGNVRRGCRTHAGKSAGERTSTSIVRPPPAMEGVLEKQLRIFVATVDELRAIVREEIAAARATNVAKHEPNDWFTASEVAALVGYRRSYVAELVRRHGLPAHQPNGRGGRLMFRRDEVETWVAQRKGKR